MTNLTKLGKLTAALIAASVIIGLWTGIDDKISVAKLKLFIAGYGFQNGKLVFDKDLKSVLNGEIWRLITPIFLHGSFIHILFNMLWLKDLGSIIENRLSPIYLAGLVVATGVISNIAQFYVSGPVFGGMSGVVFGLLGFLWVKGRFDPSFGIQLNPFIVKFMAIWFLIGVSGILKVFNVHVANTAHGVGAAVGIAWGFISSKVRF